MPTIDKVGRRDFLKTGGGRSGIGDRPLSAEIEALAGTLERCGGDQRVGAISPDDTTTLVIDKSEMGKDFDGTGDDSGG
jgi:hypothetical protein